MAEQSTEGYTLKRHTVCYNTLFAVVLVSQRGLWPACVKRIGTNGMQDWDLKRWADPATLRRGAAYVKRGAVDFKAVTEPMPGHLVVDAEVDEGPLSPVRVTLRWDGRQLHAACSCPMSPPCKHAMAVAMAHLQAPAKALPLQTADVSSGPRPGQDVLYYNLHLAPPPKRLEKQYARNLAVWVSLERAIVMDDGLPGMPRPLALWSPVKRETLSSVDASILDLLEPYYRSHHRDFSSPHAHGIPLRDDMVNPVFALLARCPFVFGAGRTALEIRPDLPIRSVGGPYEALWDIDGHLVAGSNVRLVGLEPPWLQVKESLRPLLEIAPDATDADGEGALTSASSADEINWESTQRHPAVSPRGRLMLAEEGERLIARLTFRYDVSPPVSPADARALVGGEKDGVWGAWERDPAAEKFLVERLGATALDARGASQYWAWGDAALQFLMDELPVLMREGWDVYGEERLVKLQVRRSTPHVSVGVSSGIDWFDLKTQVRIDDEVVPWASLREAFRQNSRFVRLGSGAFGRLPEEWLARQMQLGQSLGFSDDLGDASGFVQRLPHYLATSARELLEVATEVDVDVDWRQFLHGLEGLDAIPEVPSPDGFIGELRHYQLRGLARLTFWRDYGLHGILADDMGLGKTIQAIALLLHEKAAGTPGPSLLVAPTSVVYNWEQEIAKFAPGLKVLVLHGADRHTRFESLPAADVVITSYGLLQRDRATLLEHPFNYAILDEAQKIKNPRSQAAKMACRIRARRRLCLTGTPIENNLLEFWSLFHFLMPGLLGSERLFRQTYLKTEPDEIDSSRERLRRMTRPFLLRRLKQDVATDLPPRTEIVSYCELGPEQRRLYDETLAAVRGHIFAEVRSKGLRRAHFHVLEGLLRLRQVACDPQLVLKDGTRVPSSKVEQFMELLREIIAEGHRVLVFSQFVKMLTILRENLEKEGIAYAYLDGQTKDRLERVQRFNQDNTPVFLISLKAGGTGLNLTGADYVVHFDPWWNPAVEDQATDRAHRIGQTRQVFSYKLIARGTVEEKVLSLQAQKRQIVQDVLGGTDLGSELTLADLEFLLN
ncbi:MAG: DEAD/DEAH box helicase [Candidatus Sericytochromatia bacterium]|nr:DEAD/DEAH box helicase [Candidatus Sericytochromatia bacterium]